MDKIIIILLLLLLPGFGGRILLCSSASQFVAQIDLDQIDLELMQPLLASAGQALELGGSH